MFLFVSPKAPKPQSSLLLLVLTSQSTTILRADWWIVLVNIDLLEADLKSSQIAVAVFRHAEGCLENTISSFKLAR